MAYGRSYSLASSRGGFLSKLVRTAGRIAGGVVNFAAGGGLAGVAARAVSGRGVMPGGMPTLGTAGDQGRPRPGARGAMQRLIPGGESGYIKGRRLNAGNAKAARRAIRRIKSVRKLLQSIERELPRRPAARGSAGVITRAEAARALQR